MNLVVRRPRALATVTAVLLSLTVAGQALGLSWGTPVKLADSAINGARIAALDSSTVIAVYADDTGVFVRRGSLGSVEIWGPPRRVGPAGAYQPAITGLGKFVDVIWMLDGKVMYRRSTDGGASWSSATRLSPEAVLAEFPVISRGPGGRLAVAWDDLTNDRVRVRISVDGGKNFRRAAGFRVNEDGGFPAVEVAKEVMYLGYFVDGDSVRLRRLLRPDMGWGAATVIGDDGYATFRPPTVSIAALGDTAYVMYVARSLESKSGLQPYLRYRHTFDRGASWGTRIYDFDRPVASKAGRWAPDLALHSGVVRALWARCTDVECRDSRVFYSQATAGPTASWSPPEAVTSATTDSWPAGLAVAGKVAALYTTNYEPFVRTGR